MRTIHVQNILPRHKSKSYSKKNLSKVKYIVVHHFGDDVTTTEGAARYHVSKDWPGIGYYAVIEKDGSRKIVNYLDVASYNVANMNSQVIGIALRGDYSNSLPSPAMIDTLKETITELQDLVGPLQVKVHSDFVNTACPGPVLARYIKQLYPDTSPGLLIEQPGLISRFVKLFKPDPGHL